MRELCLTLICLSLLACANDSLRAPVENRHGEKKVEASKPTLHKVVHGDTLYAIAWRYGMDYRKLASINNVAVPYRIYPGQELRLTGRAAVASRTQTKTAKTVPTPSKPVSSPTAIKAAKKANKKSTAVKDMSVSNAPVSGWLWPARGKVVRGFSGTIHKGIDISGGAGGPVLATSSGRVVYAGSGIVGYGNLLIVKHNDIYLSAYGHNRRLLVKEGDKVKSGEKIAEMGSSATNSVKLHFEIRREGKPVDPKKLLPKS
jgi:lipoprotein NlpD